MKNKFLVYIVGLVLLLSVVIAVTVSSSTITDIEKNRATGTVTLNETSNATVYVSTSSTLTNPIFTSTQTDYALTHSFDITGLSPNTVYYYQFNGSNNITGSSYGSTVGNFTTTPTITGNARTVYGLLTFLVMAIILLVYGFNGFKYAKNNDDIKQVVIGFSIGLVGAIILSNIVASMLAS